jgi:hypothetical protein
MTRSRVAALLDVSAVVLFVVIGRASHNHAETVRGITTTAWPFAAGLGAGWGMLALVGRLRRRQVAPSSLAAGASVCATTVAVGVALRVVAGQGSAPAFVGVATGFLGAIMLGGRLALGAAARRLARHGHNA